MLEQEENFPEIPLAIEIEDKIEETKAETETPKPKLHEKDNFNLIPEITLTELQEKGIRFLLSRKGGILNLSTGSGKCLGFNTPVLMFDGTVKMSQNIEVGDLLMGPDSKKRTVVSLGRGREIMYEVRPFDKGIIWSCNESHILSLIRPLTGEVSNVSIVDLKKECDEIEDQVFTGWRSPVFVEGQERVLGEKRFFNFSLVSLGEGDYYGWTLKEDPLFLLGDFTVTHNTFLAAHAGIHFMDSYENTRFVCFVPAEANKVWRKTFRALKEPYVLFEAKGVEKFDCSFIEDARVFIFNFSSMEKFEAEIIERLKNYECIFLVDEAHALSNSTSRQSRSLKYYRKYARLTWLLTATSVRSLPAIRGLFNLVDFVLPGYLGSWSKFKDDFLIWRWNIIRSSNGKTIKTEEIIALKNESVLKEKLSLLMFVGTVNYNVDFHYHTCSLSEEEFSYYREAGAGLLKNFERKEFASRLHDLQRVVDNSMDGLPESLQKKISSKERLLLKVIEEKILSKNESVILFAEHISTLQRLEFILNIAKNRGLINFSQILKITGLENKKDRDKAEDSIIPGTILLASRASSQSRNLQAASHVVFYDLPFSLSVFLQSCGRITRIDSKHERQSIHIFTALETVDFYKLLLVKENAHVFTQIIEGNSNLPEVAQIDRTFIGDLRKRLLWGFKHKKILSLKELSEQAAQKDLKD